jgi:hypothetical protein
MIERAYEWGHQNEAEIASKDVGGLIFEQTQMLEISRLQNFSDYRLGSENPVTRMRKGTLPNGNSNSACRPAFDFHVSTSAFGRL